jgi:MFS family permease
LVVAVLVGLFLNGTVSGMTVIIPSLYPAEARATALGLGVAVSRLGAVLAPLIAGFLLQAGWAPGSMFRVFAIPGVIGALAIIFLTGFGRAPRDSSSPSELVESVVAEA